MHFGKLDHGIKLVAFRVSIPDGLVEELRVASLRAGWDSVPAGIATAALGTGWLSSKRSAVLKVPSVVTHGEHNYLVNPLHADAGRVRVVRSTPFVYDARIWK